MEYWKTILGHKYPNLLIDRFGKNRTQKRLKKAEYQDLQQNTAGCMDTSIKTGKGLDPTSGRCEQADETANPLLFDCESLKKNKVFRKNP